MILLSLNRGCKNTKFFILHNSKSLISVNYFVIDCITVEYFFYNRGKSPNINENSVVFIKNFGNNEGEKRRKKQDCILQAYYLKMWLFWRDNFIEISQFFRLICSISDILLING